MTFIPDFDLAKYQRPNFIIDGRYHVRRVDLYTGVCDQYLSFATEDEARIAAETIRDAGGKAGVIIAPDGSARGAYFIHTEDLID
jgi:hypothetical protein